MKSWQEQQAMIAEAASQFPETFGLRAFPGDTFRVSKAFSYVNDSDVVTVYTEVLRGEKWLSFAKGTVSELRREIVVTGNSQRLCDGCGKVLPADYGDRLCTSCTWTD